MQAIQFIKAIYGIYYYGTICSYKSNACLGIFNTQSNFLCKLSHLGNPLRYYNDMGGRWGRGPTEVLISYPKISQLQNLSIQKNPYFFSHTPKNPTLAANCIYLIVFELMKSMYNIQKNPCAFIATQKNPFWLKFEIPKNPSEPPVSKISEWAPGPGWVVSQHKVRTKSQKFRNIGKIGDIYRPNPKKPNLVRPYRVEQLKLTRTAGKTTPSLLASPSTSAFISSNSSKIASCLFTRLSLLQDYRYKNINRLR